MRHLIAYVEQGNIYWQFTHKYNTNNIMFETDEQTVFDYVNKYGADVKDIEECLRSMPLPKFNKRTFSAGEYVGIRKTAVDICASVRRLDLSRTWKGTTSPQFINKRNGDKDIYFEKALPLNDEFITDFLYYKVTGKSRKYKER